MLNHEWQAQGAFVLGALREAGYCPGCQPVGCIQPSLAAIRTQRNSATDKATRRARARNILRLRSASSASDFAAVAPAHHEEQRTAEARQNGEKGENDHEFHERIIWCAFPDFQTSGGFY
jgi:hypothetical protein